MIDGAEIWMRNSSIQQEYLAFYTFRRISSIYLLKRDSYDSMHTIGVIAQPTKFTRKSESLSLIEDALASGEPLGRLPSSLLSLGSNVVSPPRTFGAAKPTRRIGRLIVMAGKNLSTSTLEQYRPG